MKKYEAPVMSLFYAESKDIVTVSLQTCQEGDGIKKIDLSSYMDLLS